MAEVIYEKKTKIAYIMINRPDKKNAINYEVRQGLMKAWEQVNADPEVYSVIITGKDNVFSVGQDLEELAKYRQNEPVEDLPLNMEQTFGADVKKPVIAAISGYCLGTGFLLALNSDIRIASNDAQFGLPEVKMAIPPEFALTAKVAQYFPRAIALELLLLGDNISAEEAYRLGFINKIVPQRDVMPTAEDYAHKISQFSPLTVRSIKEGFYIGNSLSPQTIALLRTICRLARHSQDYREGITASVEKRKPIYKGK